ncbi:TonB-dependent receptor [Flammeovirgaceae bacterium SG7u.111]|nr:TonB-dependent receptor [Flammeovirgaceae bacterium SG7u.132]WPO38298.1 TonB-dependent receptor [Flammeovirgaceae bacterium SG7u.111]
MLKKYCILLILSIVYGFGYAQSIKGKVVDKNGEPIFAHVFIVGTTVGAATDLEGAFEIKDTPAGQVLVRAQSIGYLSEERLLKVKKGEVTELDIQLKEDLFKLEEVVVTGTRTSRKRTEAPVVVDVLDNRTLEITQSLMLSDGLSFQPGLRVETDCQTCNYTQLRMNGLGGNYSQILINSRPIFSALNGLYGLEQIPSNMIERVEVVKGGGSAVFGNNAIGGTVNIITKEPKENTFSLSYNHAFIRGETPDLQMQVNASAVNDAQNAGFSIFGVYRDRDAWDANGDGFSEMPLIKNISLGINTFIKPDNKSKLTLELHTINEKRRGGDQVEAAPHESEQAEDRVHNIAGGGLTYERWLNPTTEFSVYTSGQVTDRAHYTGFKGDDAYGNTDNRTVMAGTQLNKTINKLWGTKYNILTIGGEYVYDWVFDEIKGYDWLVDQTTHQVGLFAQSDWQLSKKLSALVGLRLDNHNFLENSVLNPRVNVKYDLSQYLQLRGSVGTGFRAPQAFDADLHIAFSGGGIAYVQLDPELRKERSISYSSSLNFDKPSEHYIFGFTLDAFYTNLDDPFILEELDNDTNGNTVLFRTNGDGQLVQGVSVEGRVNFDGFVQFETGMTFQKSEYASVVSWSQEVEGTKKALRTPEQYGFYTLTYIPAPKWDLALSGVITGPMLVPHFGGAPGVDGDRLYRSPTFWETNLKIAYTVSMKSFGQDLKLFAGIQNIFDEYQDDFDTGPNRDSNYVYGPSRPRTFYFGLKFGKF